jgi:hypothetical protein
MKPGLVCCGTKVEIVQSRYVLVQEDISFRRRFDGYNFLFMIRLLALPAAASLIFFVMIASYGGTEIISSEPELFFGMLAISSILFLIFGYYLFGRKYTLRRDTLLVRDYFSSTEIRYTSIRSVERVARSIFIKYADFDGREKQQMINPSKDQEFLVELKKRVPRSCVFTEKYEREGIISGFLR